MSTLDRKIFRDSERRRERSRKNRIAHIIRRDRELEAEAKELDLKVAEAFLKQGQKDLIDENHAGECDTCEYYHASGCDSDHAPTRDEDGLVVTCSYEPAPKCGICGSQDFDVKSYDGFMLCDSCYNFDKEV